jgi:hypothetical protein
MTSTSIYTTRRARLVFLDKTDAICSDWFTSTASDPA